jgi:hypothetical protein
LHFEAAAQYRLSQEDFEKCKYGEEIARLRLAEGLTKKGIDAGKRGVAESVVAETKVSQIVPSAGAGADAAEPPSGRQDCLGEGGTR